MSFLYEIRPVRQQRVIDLARSAGIDVSDWTNYKNGAENPGANPKYCYEWALVEPNALVLLNLWFDAMLERNEGLEHRLNFRDSPTRTEINATRRARRQRMEEAVHLAYESGLPVRVIVLSGNRRKTGGATVRGAQVKARLLDPVAWAVASYDSKTGDAILKRGLRPVPYVDQFSLPPPPEGASGSHDVHGRVRDRSPEVRRYVLLRAKGHCEFCGAAGFKLKEGAIYLETHHVIPLCEDGIDGVSNVAALCPNHHREAHYGEAAADITRRLVSLLSPACT